MVAPIITFVFAAGVAGLAYWGTTVDPKMSDPAPVEDTVSDDAPADGE